jgi:hypothetical protein
VWNGKSSQQSRSLGMSLVNLNIETHSNFEITDIDFLNLKYQLTDLMQKEKLGLFKYRSISDKCWEENYIKLNKIEAEEMLNKKENLAYSNRTKDAYFALELEGF